MNQRDSSGASKFSRLESVRGFAALYVGLCHLGWLGILGVFAQEAVMVFFVLSGFVIGWTASQHFCFRAYYLKRFLRIYSVWVPAVIFLFGIEVIQSGEWVFPSATDFFGNLFMLQDLGFAKPAVFCEPIFGNGPLWSLHYEWWFYMVFPFVLLAPRKSRAHLVGSVAVLSAGLYVFVPNAPCRILMYLSIWWIGVEAARLLRETGEVKFRRLLPSIAYVFLAAIPLGCLVLKSYFHGLDLSPGLHPVLEFRHMISSVLLVCVAFVWRSLGWYGFKWTVGTGVIFAPISYSFYIVHYRSIANASYLGFLHLAWLQQLLYWVTTIVFCIVVELVFFPMLRKWSKVSKERAPLGHPTDGRS